MSPRDQAHTVALDALQAGASALYAEVPQSMVVPADIPPLKCGEQELSFYLLWPGILLELGKSSGEVVAETPVGDLMKRRCQSALHLAAHTRGRPLLRRPLHLSDGRPVVAVFLATGRVLVRDSRTGHLIARSKAGRPFDLDPAFEPRPVRPADEAEDQRQGGE